MDCGRGGCGPALAETAMMTVAQPASPLPLASGRIARKLAIAAAALLFAASALAAQAEDAGGKPVGEAFYGSSFKDLHDQQASFGQFKGKVVVIYFWATWCVPCRVETPNLVKLNEEYKGKDVQVIGLALDNGDKVREFVHDNSITYPIFYGGREAVQLGKALGNDQGAIPFTVVIGKDGKLVHTLKGDLPNEDLEKIINPLIG